MTMDTNSVSSNDYSLYNSASKSGTKANSTSDKAETGKTASTRKAGNYGKMIGNAKLSEAGAKYYEQLKKKYGTMDFILVSSDQKANAQANAGKYANASKMVVLIDEEKIERMVTDENFRKQYEGIIKNAASGLSQMKAQIESSGMSGKVQGYGMQVNDGGMTSFFAVLKKSSSDQKARIEKKAEAKKAEKKAAEKKAEKKEAEERLQKSREEDAEKLPEEDTVLITANSIEELMKKMNDYIMAERSDYLKTKEELQVGQNIDFRG